MPNAFRQCVIRLAVAIVAMLFAAHVAFSAIVSATLDRNVIPVGESVTLTLTFEGAQPQAAPTLPNIPNLAFQSLAQGSSFTIDNGQVSLRFTCSYTLQATQPGDVTIPAIQTQVGGQILTTQPLTLKVIPATATPNAATNLAFLRLVVPKTQVYVGEAFPLEIHLYYQNIESPQYPQIKSEGFSFGQQTEPVQGQTRVGDVPYNLITFKTTAAAARAGNLTLGPAECRLVLRIPARRRDFDPFGMFDSFQRRPATLQSEALEIQVLPLPSENVPATFNGAVGHFGLAVTAGPTNIAVGDPITVKAAISGRGRLEGLTWPDQQQWRDFRTYPPTRKIEGKDALGLAGTVIFEQVVIPQNHEIKILPAAEFSFFDPVQKEYRTLKGPAIPLAIRNVAAAAVPPPVPTNAAAAQAPAADDILHIRSQFAAAGGSALLIRQPWFIALQIFPVAAWLALLIRRIRRESLANNPRLRRQREVAQRVREGLKELHSLAASENSDAFFATLFRLLQEQIGERLDLPASAITEAIIDERLRTSNLSGEIVTELHELFQMCNQARYAPQKTSQQLSAIIPRAEAVLRELQKLRA